MANFMPCIFYSTLKKKEHLSIQWEEASDAAEHLTLYKTAPATRNVPTSITRADAEKSCFHKIPKQQ